MNDIFSKLLESLEPSCQRLLEMTPVCVKSLPKDIPQAGIYLLSEGGINLFVGRSNRMRQRLQEQYRPSSTHNSAPFAFKLARKETGCTKASYTGEGSRKDLEADIDFKEVFDAQKGRVGNMDVRFVEEADPVKQALLELYISISLNTIHNDFDNH